jgi:hypothetical protein
LDPACVIIPVYAAELSQSEQAALICCIDRLRDRQIFLLHKASIDINSVLDQLGVAVVDRKRIKCGSVEDKWLSSVASYNAMLLQGWFYRMFANWSYVLIYQLDAWVFGDALGEWLAKAYTYVGAPWTGHLGPDTPDTGVGNGGFSLRCVAEMIRICESPRWRFVPVFRWRILAYRMTLLRRYHLFPVPQRPLLFAKRLALFVAMSLGWRNTLAYYASIGIQEDHVLSVYAPLVFPWMRIPSMAEAATFSVETNPRQTFAAYGITRPFGCHAWEKHDRDFWLATFPHDFKIGQ